MDARSGSGMTEEKELPVPHIVIAGLTGNLRCPIGVGHDVRGKVRCPIGVGHDNETVGHDKEEERAGRGEKKDSPKGGLSGNGYCLM